MSLIFELVRLVGVLARETADSGAIVLGLRWRDSKGKSHWHATLRR